MDAIKEEKEGLEELLANNQEKIEQLQPKVVQLESNLESCSTVKTGLEEERNRLIQQITWQESQLQTVSGSDEAIKSLTDQLANLESANADLNIQVENFATNAKALEDERNRLIQQVSDFESRLQDGANVDELKKKLEGLESANQQLHQQLEELKSTKTEPTQVSYYLSLFCYNVTLLKLKIGLQKSLALKGRLKVLVKDGQFPRKEAFKISSSIFVKKTFSCFLLYRLKRL